MARDGWQAQSTIELMLRGDVPVTAVAGEGLNFKLTAPGDWLLAHALHLQLQS